MKILLFGASGSGTTTLGKALAQKLAYTFLDADDFYWAKTDPPFTEKIPLKARSENLRTALESEEDVIISGSLVSWGEYWTGAFDLAVFLHLPPAVRLQRLQAREQERYGDMLENDPERKANSRAFLEWAAQYDAPDFAGRSIRQHEDWMKKLSCPVLRIKGAIELADKLDFVEKYLNMTLGKVK